MKTVLNNPAKNWKWNSLSGYMYVTMKDILENQDKPWVWDILSSNIRITTKDVLDNPDMPWDWSRLSQNYFEIPRPEDSKRQIRQCIQRTQIFKSELIRTTLMRI